MAIEAIKKRERTAAAKAAGKNRAPKNLEGLSAEELGIALTDASAAEQQTILERLRDTKGAEYTQVLMRVSATHRGELRDKARAALVERMQRMTAKTLQAYFEDEEPELRHAAIKAAGKKGDKSLIPDLIARLRFFPFDPPTGEYAHAALQELTGVEIGKDLPHDQAGYRERYRLWQNWWRGRQKKP